MKREWGPPVIGNRRLGSKWFPILIEQSEMEMKICTFEARILWHGTANLAPQKELEPPTFEALTPKRG